MSFYRPPCEISYNELLCSYPKLLPPALRAGADMGKTPYYIAKPKIEALDIRADSDNPGFGCVRLKASALKVAGGKDGECVGLGAVAQWIASSQFDILRSQFHQIIREQHPATAFSTIDGWLSRLGWSDCFLPQCSAQDGDLPDGIDIWCGSEDYTLALKHAILLALVRARGAGIINLARLNYILEPLGAAAIAEGARQTPFDAYSLFMLAEAADAGGTCAKEEIRLELRHSSNSSLYLPAESCGGAETRIDPVLRCERQEPAYGNVLAAACLARALIYDRRIKIIPLWKVNEYG